MAIEHISTLRPGETPWQHGETGSLPGPWGASAAEAIATYERETGDTVREHWTRGAVLWVVTDASTEVR